MRDAAWVSEELRGELVQLSAQQAAGVLRIVQAELQGESLHSLLEGPDKICTSTTYYGSGSRRGWRGKPAFNRALELARRDYRSWLLQNGTQDALLILAESAPEAARALRQQVAGDERALTTLVRALEDPEPEMRSLAVLALGETGLPQAVPHLRAALEREENASVRHSLVIAIGRIAAWRDSDRRDAAGQILNRADVRTASKSSSEQLVRAEFGYVEDLSDDELDQLLDNLEAAEGGGTD